MPDLANPLNTGAVMIAVVVALMLTVLSLSVLAGIIVFRPRIRLRNRMAALGLVGQRGNVQSGRAVNPRQRRIQEKLNQLEKETKKRSRHGKLRAELLRAGIEMNVRRYMVMIVFIGIVAAAGLVLARVHWAVAIGVSAVGAYWVPRIFLRLRAKHRQKKFTENFATAIDVLVRGVKTGLPIGECLSVIGRESPEPVGEEFRQLVEGQKVGVEIEELLRRGIERIPTADFKFFAIVLQIQKQTGGSLADTLEGLSTVLRERKKMKDKVKALSSEAKSSAAIIGSLPFFVAGMISLINPGYMQLLFTTTTGNMMLAGGLLWMGLGVFVMSKMINFEI